MSLVCDSEDRLCYGDFTEQWHQETDAIHLLIGEAIVTLQDVKVLLGLQIEARAVTSHSTHDVPATCYELLGLAPDVVHLITQIKITMAPRALRR